MMIDFNKPVVGKLEVGKTYLDREGNKHTISRKISGGGQYVVTTKAHTYTEDGAYGGETTRSIFDLVAEYHPPEPLKMWMNEDEGGSRFFYDNDAQARAYAPENAIRIAIPVTITEGH